jgi:hypothetical protein
MQARHYRHEERESTPFILFDTARNLAGLIGQNKVDAEKGLQRGGSIINVASFVAKLGAATPQLACMS